MIIIGALLCHMNMFNTMQLMRAMEEQQKRSSSSSNSSGGGSDSRKLESTIDMLFTKGFMYFIVSMHISQPMAVFENNFFLLLFSSLRLQNRIEHPRQIQWDSSQHNATESSCKTYFRILFLFPLFTTRVTCSGFGFFFFCICSLCFESKQNVFFTFKNTHAERRKKEIKYCE